LHLAIDSLRVSYGYLEVIHGMGLEVDEGITALIGPNGAGKTTTLSAIAGILPVSGGSISFGGKDITKFAPSERVELGLALVPEGRRLFSRMSVKENLLSGAFCKRARTDCDANLEKVCDLFPVLKEKIDQPASTLSGGQMQMVAIGRALMCEPTLLMLDEPSLGLAPMVVENLFDLIRQVAERGISILLVEQNLMEALRLAKRGHVIEQGNIVLSGESSEVANDPYVKQSYLGL